LDADSALPAWVAEGTFFSVTRTMDELSFVVEEKRIPTGVPRDGPWRAIKIEGPIPLSAVGVLVSIAAPLARASISLFAVSTFDTDYILVRADRQEAARLALSQAGHTVW
jgi:hypothetical protein